MKILVVEDDPNLISTYTIVLQSEGHEVHAFNTVAGALDYLDDTCPDLILLDYLMDQSPESIVSRARKKGCRTLLLTAVSNAEVVAENYGLDFLRKPFQLEDLTHMMAIAHPPKSR